MISRLQGPIEHSSLKYVLTRPPEAWKHACHVPYLKIEQFSMNHCPAPSLNNGAPVLSTNNILGILQWCSISISNCIIELPHTEHHTRIHERKALREVYCNEHDEWANSYWNPLATFGRYQFTLVNIMVCVCLYVTVQIQSNMWNPLIWKYRQYRHIGNHQYRRIGISAKMSYRHTLSTTPYFHYTGFITYNMATIPI